MATGNRRQKKTAADDIFEAVARLPWKIGLALAVVVYLVVHYFATRTVPAPAAGRLPTQAIWQSLAAVAQYILPLPFLLGAVVSFLMEKKRSQMVDEVAAEDGMAAMREMSWRDFETMTGEAFRLRGYDVTETGGGGADGGVDLVLRRGGEKFLVQCKQWRALKVPVNVVRELYGVMAAQGAAGGYVVTCGSFTDDAKAFAEGRNIWLINGAQLKQMADSVKKNAGAPSTPAADAPAPAGETAPACPRCGAPMVRRTAQRGEHAGEAFWGCTKYPGCRGLLKIDHAPRNTGK